MRTLPLRSGQPTIAPPARHVSLVATVALFGATTFGCAHPPRAAAPVQPNHAAVASLAKDPGPAAPPADPSAALRSCRVDDDCGASSLCVEGRCVAATAELAACRNAQVHFDVDAAELPASELPVVQRMARCLRGDARLHLTIEGNADERGTDEYNLALGDRRASVVETYLSRLGIPAARLRTVSYGKERPLCGDHTEACWSQNRRASLVAN